MTLPRGDRRRVVCHYPRPAATTLSLAGQALGDFFGLHVVELEGLRAKRLELRQPLPWTRGPSFP